jgi:hypothetical protein
MPIMYDCCVKNISHIHIVSTIHQTFHCFTGNKQPDDEIFSHDGLLKNIEDKPQFKPSSF